MIVTPLDEDGVTPKGVQPHLNEPKSAKIPGQEQLETEPKDEVNTNKESQKLSFSSKIGGPQHLPFNINLGGNQAEVPAPGYDKSPGRG